MTQRAFFVSRSVALIQCAAMMSASGLIPAALNAQTNLAGATASHAYNQEEEFMDPKNIANEALPEVAPATVTNIVLVTARGPMAPVGRRSFP